MSLSGCYWENKTHNQVERETQHNVPSMTIARNIITLSTDLTNSNKISTINTNTLRTMNKGMD